MTLAWRAEEFLELPGDSGSNLATFTPSPCKHTIRELPDRVCRTLNSSARAHCSANDHHWQCEDRALPIRASSFNFSNLHGILDLTIAFPGIIKTLVGVDNVAGQEEGLLAREVGDIAHHLGTGLGDGLLEVVESALPDHGALDGVGAGGVAQVGDVVLLEAELGPLLGDKRHVLGVVVLQVELGVRRGGVDDADEDGRHFDGMFRRSER